MIATLTTPELIGYSVGAALLAMLALIQLNVWRHPAPPPGDDDPRSLHYEITWPSRDLVPVADGIWRDADGGYVFAAPYLAHLAAEFPTLDCRRVLSIATQIAMDRDGVPALSVPLRDEARSAV